MSGKLITNQTTTLPFVLALAMSILHMCMNKDVQVWTIKDNYRLGADIQSKVLAFAFGLSAEIERNLISQRTKEALLRVRSEGKILGRPKGRQSAFVKLSGKENKVKELLEDTQIDEGRIASEIVIFADKICTDEEVVRLRSHVEHMKATLQSDDSGIGRKLDFIAQEMNREANTILSKANDLETSNIGIELKTEIEKVREQIQNLE